MKEDIFAVSGAIGKALATKTAGKKTMSQDSAMSELRGGVATDMFGERKRKVYDSHGLFRFLATPNISTEEKEEEEKKHQERLMELMHMYQQYHGIIASQQYALRGSILRCQYGTNFARLDCARDYGIHRFGLPALTVIDCKAENIHSFGSCCCPEVNYLGRLPMTVASDLQGNQAIKADCNVFPHICVPLVDGNYGWKQIDENLLVKVNAQHYAPMLTDNAVLVCQYGGIISVLEVVSVDSKQAEKIDIAPWLHGFRGEPDAHGGTKVTYSSKERDKLSQIRSPLAWYSYENQTEKNPNCEPYLVGQDFKDGGNGELVDQKGRYWITLGPKVFDPNYSDLGNCNADYFKEQIGCRVDVVLQLIKDEKEYVYIECLWSGNIKAHTFNNGIFQTGHPYPESTEAKKHPYQIDYVDGSIVEFTGKFTGDNGTMSKYRVAYLVVYPKE